ncbi:hypothetical protein GH5_06238 [Leishmania sp. Ghana 2012 LV757]|uniref:hypothetical protein n=1 Tax=Leishmania sp. Ghana 2012 LV757 TaxID=2803181 RepID=UPI001B63176D|nr:hypothetical protein GH5_06238 [Leishmania sp. Ghana 2012 LV757]
MRRTRHWYVALVHWLRCGGGASLSQVAGKSPGVTPTATKRLPGVTPVTDLSFCPPSKYELGLGNESLKGAAVEHTQTASCCNADALSDYSAPSDRSDAVQRAGVDEDMIIHLMSAPESTLASPRLRSRHRAAEDKDRAHRCAGVAMCDRMVPMLNEIRGIVGELHHHAARWSTVLTSDVDRSDNLVKRTDKTRAKNGGIGLRASGDV